MLPPEDPTLQPCSSVDYNYWSNYYLGLDWHGLSSPWGDYLVPTWSLGDIYTYGPLEVDHIELTAPDGMMFPGDGLGKGKPKPYGGYIEMKDKTKTEVSDNNTKLTLYVTETIIV